MIKAMLWVFIFWATIIAVFTFFLHNLFLFWKHNYLFLSMSLCLSSILVSHLCVYLSLCIFLHICELLDVRFSFLFLGFFLLLFLPCSTTCLMPVHLGTATCEAQTRSSWCWLQLAACNTQPRAHSAGSSLSGGKR